MKVVLFSWVETGGEEMTEKEINVPERLQEIGKKLGEFRDAVEAEFKDMEVDVRNWSFAVGKAEAEYTVDVNLKLAIKPKKK
jgi:hypothetical protein